VTSHGNLTGISTLEIQPSGLAVLPAAAAADGVARLLIPSVFSVLSTPLAGGLVSIHVPVPGMDLEDMQVLPDVDLFTGEPSAGTTLVRLAGNSFGETGDKSEGLRNFGRERRNTNLIFRQFSSVKLGAFVSRQLVAAH
jgi:hypothetical protein